MDVSIVIVNWNTRDILCDCLRSVYRDAGDIEFEVIVTDNASTDGSVEMIKEEFPQVVLIANSQNVGFAAANNQGIAVAKSRYVLLLNSDTVVLDNAIARTVSFADANPEAGIVGCRVLNPDMSLQPSCFMFPSLLNMFLSSTGLYKMFPGSRFFGREEMAWWDYRDVREVDVVRGCFMFARSEAIEQVGVMDDDYFMYAEETDWCYRFKKAGWKILFTPDAEIIHIHGASTRKRKTAMTLQLRSSILLFVRKNRNYLTYIIACLLVALFFAIRIPYWLAKYLVSRTNKSDHSQVLHAYTAGAFGALAGWQGLLKNPGRKAS